MLQLGLIIAGLVLAIVGEVTARGKSILGYAVILIAIALLIGIKIL